jgi:hypothetical protein
VASKLDPPRSIAPISSSDPQSIVTSDWLLWFFAIYGILTSSTQTVGTPLALTGQGAAIGLSTLTLPALQNGRYRVSWYIHISAPDGAGSSVQLTIGFTQGAQALTKTFPAITGDTLTTFDQASMFILIDQNTGITYQTAYSSTTPGKMKYSLNIAVESV